MSIYSELLASAEGQRTPEEDGPVVGDAVLSQVLACRSQIDGRPPGVGDDQLIGDLADNIAYDLALVSLCRSRGIGVDLARFDRPLVERRRLEEELKRLGLDVETLNSPPTLNATD